MSLSIEELKKHFPRRPADAHKGDFGHVFILAGSVGYTGAAYLASQAAVVAGAGLVTLATGKTIYPILAEKLTEVMVRPFFETKDGSLSMLAEKDLVAFAAKCTAVAIGPGLSTNAETERLVRALVAELELPMVIDADGLAALNGHLDILKKRTEPTVLTPHPGEMARLVGSSVDEVQKHRKDVALTLAHEYNTVLILKGHETIVAAPSGDFYINQTGNVGMASGGTGDVLTGIIASFLGQGIEVFAASALGAYCHGAAGDSAARDKGVISMTATDLLQALPGVLKGLA